MALFAHCCFTEGLGLGATRDAKNGGHVFDCLLTTNRLIGFRICNLFSFGFRSPTFEKTKEKEQIHV